MEWGILSDWFAPKVQQFFQVISSIADNNCATEIEPSREDWYNYISPSLWRVQFR